MKIRMLFATKLYFNIFIISMFLFFSCKKYDCNRYNVSPKKVEKNNINIESSLYACNDKLMLSLNVKNNSADTIKLDYMNCTLTIDSGRAALPESEERFKTTLLPGQSENYNLIYHPVNSLTFYNRINYRGDMKRQYILNLNLIQGKKEMIDTITFLMDEKNYQKYLEKSGLENRTQLFDMIYDDSFISDQVLYLKNTGLKDELEDSVLLVSNSDILFKKRIITFSAYKRSDTLVLNVRLINNGANKLIAKLNKLEINAAGHNFKPVSIESEFFNYNQIADSSVIIKRGARFTLLLKYKIPENINQYSFNSDWLLISGKYALLYRDIDFTAFL